MVSYEIGYCSNGLVGILRSDSKFNSFTQKSWSTISSTRIDKSNADNYDDFAWSSSGGYFYYVNENGFIDEAVNGDATPSEWLSSNYEVFNTNFCLSSFASSYKTEQLNAAGSICGHLTVANASSRQNVRPQCFKICEGRISSLAFANEDTLVCSGTDDGRIYCCNLQSNSSAVLHASDEFHTVRQVQCNNLRKIELGSVADDGFIRFWDLTTSTLTFLDKIQISKGQSAPLAFSPINKTLAVAVQSNGYVFCYDLNRNRLIKEFSTSSPLCSSSLHFNGYTMALGSSDGMVFFYDLRKFDKLLSSHKIGSHAIKKVAFRNSYREINDIMKSVKNSSKKVKQTDSVSSKDSGSIRLKNGSESVRMISHESSDVRKGLTHLLNSCASKTSDYSTPSVFSPLLSRNHEEPLSNSSAAPASKVDTRFNRTVLSSVFSPLNEQENLPTLNMPSSNIKPFRDSYKENIQIPNFQLEMKKTCSEESKVPLLVELPASFDKTAVSETYKAPNLSHCSIAANTCDNFSEQRRHIDASSQTEDVIPEESAKNFQTETDRTTSTSTIHADFIRPIVEDCMEEFEERFNTTFRTFYSQFLWKFQSLADKTDMIVKNTNDMNSLIKENERLRLENERLKVLRFGKT